MIVYVLAILIVLTFLLSSHYYRQIISEKDRIINELTITDIETGTYNRKFFERVFLTEYHRARRMKQPLTIILVETDDTESFSQILLSSVKRETDYIARYDDVLFVILLSGVDSEGVDEVVKRIMGNLGTINVNMGINIIIPDRHSSSANMINEAEKALNLSKAHGKNTIEYSLKSL